MDSMKGRTVVITGPTSGIGREIAAGLARLGATLVLGCRDTAKGLALAGELSAMGADGTPTVVGVDLATRSSVHQFAREVLRAHPRIHVLVNNAGVSRGTNPREQNDAGVELTFATNVLGYYLVSDLLLPGLRAAAPARIVNVASTFASDLELDDLQFTRRPWDSMKAYAQSKACDRLLTWELARRLEGSGVTANAMAPGLIVDTGLYRNAPQEVMARLRPRGGGRTPADGADTAVWLASSQDLAGVTGKLWENRKEIPCQFRGTEPEGRLWRICESLAR